MCGNTRNVCAEAAAWVARARCYCGCGDDGGGYRRRSPYLGASHCSWPTFGVALRRRPWFARCAARVCNWLQDRVFGCKRVTGRSCLHCRCRVRVHKLIKVPVVWRCTLLPQLLAWRDSGGEPARALWSSLCSCNVEVEAAVAALRAVQSSLPEDDYNRGLALCASTPASQVRRVDGVVACRACQVASTGK